MIIKIKITHQIHLKYETAVFTSNNKNDKTKQN